MLFRLAILERNPLAFHTTITGFLIYLTSYLWRGLRRTVCRSERPGTNAMTYDDWIECISRSQLNLVASSTTLDLD